MICIAEMVSYLVPRDELVGECESRHEPPLLQPEDGREWAGEEDALHSGKGHDTLPKGRIWGRNPVQGPVGLALHAGQGFDGVEQLLPKEELNG